MGHSPRFFRINFPCTFRVTYQDFVPVPVTSKAKPRISPSFTSRHLLSSGHFSFSIILRESFLAGAGRFFGILYLIDTGDYE